MNMTDKKPKGTLYFVSEKKKPFFTYSFWFTVASIALTIVSVLLPYMGFLQPIISMQAYGWAMFGLNAIAAGARFVKQYALEKPDNLIETVNDKNDMDEV